MSNFSSLKFFLGAIAALLVLIIVPYFTDTNIRTYFNSIGINDFIVIICIIILIILILIRLYIGPESKKDDITSDNSSVGDDIPSDDSRYIPSEVRAAVAKRDRGRCANCGSNRQIEYDHIIPISKGGTNTINNIQILCRNCNRQKHAKFE